MPRAQSFALEIELANKFSSVNNNVSDTPGAIYNPNYNPKHTNAPVYSFGFKRENKNQSALTKLTSTPLNVGPGLYDPDKRSLSTQKNEIHVKFSRTGKMSLENTNQYTHETYEQYSSVGTQMRSRKTTEGRCRFDKASKGATIGIFKQDLSMQMPKMNLPHAHY